MALEPTATFLSESGESLDSYMETEGLFRPSKELVVKVGVQFRVILGDDEVLPDALVTGAGDPRQPGVVADDRLPPLPIIPAAGTVPTAGEGEEDERDPNIRPDRGE